MKSYPTHRARRSALAAAVLLGVALTAATAASSAKSPGPTVSPPGRPSGSVRLLVSIEATQSTTWKISGRRGSDCFQSAFSGRETVTLKSKPTRARAWGDPRKKVKLLVGDVWPDPKDPTSFLEQISDPLKKGGTAFAARGATDRTMQGGGQGPCGTRPGGTLPQPPDCGTRRRARWVRPYFTDGGEIAVRFEKNTAWLTGNDGPYITCPLIPVTGALPDHITTITAPLKASRLFASKRNVAHGHKTLTGSAGTLDATTTVDWTLTFERVGKVTWRDDPIRCRPVGQVCLPTK